MIVMKFGGTSVGSAEAFRRVATVIESRKSKSPVVVVSAMAKTTDELLSLAHAARDRDGHRVEALVEHIYQKHRRMIEQLDLEGTSDLEKKLQDAVAQLRGEAEPVLRSGDLNEQRLDRIVSWGEYLSANILSVHLSRQGLRARWLDSRQLLLTDSRFGRARPLVGRSGPRAKGQLLPALAEGVIPVIQGFIGADEEGNTTTLGRGGSDYSATLVASLIGAEGVEIWTDVDGIMTADPSLVPEAGSIDHLTFEEAAELAYFGAKVLHPATILPAVEAGIPVFVLNSMRPGESGTEIVPPERSAPGRAGRVQSIAYKEGLSVLNIKSTRMLMAHGFLLSIFEVFNRYETAVDLVATSEVSVSVTIDRLRHLDEIIEELSEFAEVEVRHGKAIVCLVGEAICRTPGLPSRVFRELEGIEISMISQGASRINISFVINEADLPVVIKRLHDHFFAPQAYIREGK